MCQVMDRGQKLLVIVIAGFCCNPGVSGQQYMKVISTKGTLLSVLQSNCTNKDICNSSNTLTNDLSMLFTPWSHWSNCKNNSGSFIQTRERTCQQHNICDKTILKEEKPCKRKKKKKRKKFREKLIMRSRQIKKTFHVVAIPSLIATKHLDLNAVPIWSRSGVEKSKRVYSKWSRWTMCSKSCLTQRYRWCRKVEVCGNDVIRQTAYCFTEGGHCESWLQSKFALETNNYSTPQDSKQESPLLPVHTALVSPEINQELPQFSIQNSDTLIPQVTPTTQPLVSEKWTKCGVSSNNTIHQMNMLRIIGGRPTQNGKWPWIVAVLNRFKEAFCGGTLVSPRWVLTAAHCVRKRLYVSIGEYDLNHRDENELRLRVKRSVIHPKYNAETVDNDVALLYLPIEIPQDTKPRVACLPKPRDHLPFKQMCTIVGWGKQKISDAYGTDILHEAQVPIVAKQICRVVYSDFQITHNMFCAGYRRGRMDACSGDSGGPLLCQDEHGRWTVFGITSFGEGCGKRGKYGIYTKLPNYVRWLQRVINSE